MLQTRLKALRTFDKKPMPNWGSNLEGIHFDNIKYFVRSSEKQAATWDDLPADIKNTYDRLGIPEAEKQRLVSGVAAQYESEVVYHSIREDLEKPRASSSLTPTPRLREHPGTLQAVLRDGDPRRRQQVLRAEYRGVVGWLVHLRAEGCPRRHPPAGVLPDQHREHGSVRAHADHRRRGRLRALRRGLHRADLQERLAALGGRRDHREARWPLPIHDHSELVEQRLQPGDQAGPRRSGRHDGMGRRQHRLQGDDEVPGRVDDRRARQGRGAVGGVRGRGPASGHRRENASPGAEHVEQHRVQICRAWRRPGVLPWPCSGQQGRARLALHRSNAMRCLSIRSAAATPTRTSTSARTTSRWVTRPRCPRSARTSCSI